jgi:hypothetical protein
MIYNKKISLFLMLKKLDYLLLVILIILIIILLYCTYNYEYFSDTCDLPDLLNKIIKKRNIKNVYIPCSYNTCEEDAKKLVGEKDKKLFLIEGCDQLASKLDLWRAIKEQFGSNANHFMPETFLLEDKDDIEKFKSHYLINKTAYPNQMYVLKNYAQRQEGIKLTRDLDEVINGLSKGWYLVQDYVYNPFLIDKRKTNMRFYLLIICYDNKINGYLHQDGFMYYTPEYYEQEDMDFKKHITTGYIDRKVYETNPLTLDDFRKHIGLTNANLFDHNVYYLMNSVVKALSKKICNNSQLQDKVRFQLFGCDIAPDSQLNVKLMEINKGPDMGAKDERDKQVKIKVQEDIFNLVMPENKDNNRFIKIF